MLVFIFCIFGEVSNQSVISLQYFEKTETFILIKLNPENREIISDEIAKEI